MVNSVRAFSVIYLVYVSGLFQANNASEQMNEVTVHRNSQFNGTGENRKTVLNSFVSIPIGQCIWECKSRSDCKAVEYKLQANYCSLRSDVLEVVRAPGHLAVTGFGETNSCSSMTCDAGETCDYQQDTCVVKECGHPDIQGHIMGNMYGIKNRLVYTCLEDVEQRATCAENGEWHQVTDGLTCRNVRISNPQAKSGLYKNRLDMTIYCEFEDDGKDWLVFQRRLDGSVDFYRNWTEYKNGFGDPCGEFWFGLENIRAIQTASGSLFEMRVDLEDWEGNKRFALYDTFGIGDEDDGYRLLCVGYSGTTGNGINELGLYHSGMMFTTKYRDNDLKPDGNCAVIYHGAWWYKNCHQSNLNGQYYSDGLIPMADFARGIIWYPWKGNYYSFKKVSMKMREKA